MKLRHPRRRADRSGKTRPGGGGGRVGRKRKARPATVKRKNLRLDQAKLDLLRRSLGVATDQEAVERVIDDAVADRELMDATVDLGGALPGIVDIGRGS
jgi:hypothetical protein